MPRRVVGVQLNDSAMVAQKTAEAPLVETSAASHTNPDPGWKRELKRDSASRYSGELRMSAVAASTDAGSVACIGMSRY
jgi:hypothetical protein